MTTEITKKTIQLEYNTPNPSYFTNVKSTLLTPYKAIMALWTVRNIRNYPELPISEQMPQIQIWCEKLANVCGLNPCYPRISELHLPVIIEKKVKFPFIEKEFTLKYPIFNTSHLVKEELLNKAIFQRHRRVNFNGSTSYDTFFELTKTVFPETIFDKEDTIFTCGPEFTIIARRCIHNAMNAVDLNNVINIQAENLLQRWKEYAKSGEKFNVVTETNHFSTGVMAAVFLGQMIDSIPICESVHYMNSYIFKKALHLNTEDDDSKFLQSCRIFNDSVNNLINNEMKEYPIPLFLNTNESHEHITLTTPQKKALILTLFFAGQETTSFGLDAHLSFYALNLAEQEKILDVVRQENKNINEIREIKEVIARRLLEAPPVHGIAKKLRNDTRISYADITGKTFSKYLKEGEKVVPVITHTADKILRLEKFSDSADPVKLIDRASIFGYGDNGCPGKKLALRELSQLPIRILENFIIMTDETEFKYQSKLTKQAKPFYITVKCRD